MIVKLSKQQSNWLKEYLSFEIEKLKAQIDVGHADSVRYLFDLRVMREIVDKLVVN